MNAKASPDLFLTHSAEQTQLRESCREVLEREMSIESVRERLESDSGWDRRCWKTIRELGWTGVAVPEAFDGVGLGLVEVGLLAEEFGRLVQPGPFLTSAAVTLALVQSGDADQKSRWLPRLATGDTIGTWSVDVEGTCGEVHARQPNGHGQLLLGGTRRFVPAMSDADLLIVEVLHDGHPALALVPTDAAGLRVRRMKTVDLTRAFFEVQFDGVELDVGSLLLGRDGVDPRGHLVNVATAIQCAESVGAARRLLERTVEYAQQRRQFDRVIGSFQAIKHRLADMRVRVESSMVASRYATWSVAGNRADAGRSVHVAKQYGGESCSWVASEALQLHGGIAFTWEHDLHLYLRRLKANELVLGSPDWHALQLGCWRLQNAAN